MRYARQMRKLQAEEAEVAALTAVGGALGLGAGGEFRKPPAPPVTKTPAETLEAFRRIGVPIVLEKAN